MNIQSYSLLWTDHLFVVGFAVIFPLVGFVKYRKNMAKLLSGEVSRRSEYLWTAAIQWAFAAVAAVLWQFQGRDWSELGFRLQLDGNFLIAVIIVILIVGFLLAQLKAVNRGDEALLEKLASEFESVKAFMPHTPDELKAFYGLSFTAGIVEEWLWRGFLIWYLGSFLPLWLAAILSGLIFGVGHAYQGAASIPKLSIVGVAFAGLYLLSGSIWLPMLVHVVGDMVQGRTAHDFLRVREATT